MGCGAGRFLCLNRDAPKQTERCISQRLVCDSYPNCGFVDNQDEYSSTCSQRNSTLTGETRQDGTGREGMGRDGTGWDSVGRGGIDWEMWWIGMVEARRDTINSNVR